MGEHAAASMAAPADAEEQLRALAEVFGEDYAQVFEDPVVFRRHCFQSPASKQFYKRDFPLVSRTLFLESVYRRRPAYNQEVLDRFAVAVAKRLADIQLLISTQSARLKKLCESNGQMTDAAFLHPQQVLVPIIAAHANSYIRCLLRLDELDQLSGSATLNGVIDGSQRKTVELLCRKAIRGFGSMMRHESAQLRKESARMRMGAALPDTELERAEGAQEEAVRAAEEAAMGDDDNAREAPLLTGMDRGSPVDAPAAVEGTAQRLRQHEVLQLAPATSLRVLRELAPGTGAPGPDADSAMAGAALG